ncbi:MAG: hypothetical protein WC520_03620 [Candidatus Paceibacterota bacterium]
MEEYTKEFFWSVYKTLPEDLKEAIFSERNNEIIYNICSKLGLDEEKISIVAKYTGRVLMGLLSLKDFPVTLELELNIDENLANQISISIDNSVFKHLKVSMIKLEEKKSGGNFFNLSDREADKEKVSAYERILNIEQERSREALKEKEKTETEKETKKVAGSIAFPKISSLESFVREQEAALPKEPEYEKPRPQFSKPTTRSEEFQVKESPTILPDNSVPDEPAYQKPLNTPAAEPMESLKPKPAPDLQTIKNLADTYADLGPKTVEPAIEKPTETVSPVLKPFPIKETPPTEPKENNVSGGSSDPYRELPV